MASKPPRNSLHGKVGFFLTVSTGYSLTLRYSTFRFGWCFMVSSVFRADEWLRNRTIAYCTPHSSPIVILCIRIGLLKRSRTVVSSSTRPKFEIFRFLFRDLSLGSICDLKRFNKLSYLCMSYRNKFLYCYKSLIASDVLPC